MQSGACLIRLRLKVAFVELLEVLKLPELEPLSQHAQATVMLCIAERQNVVNLNDDQAFKLVVVKQGEHSRIQTGLAVLQAAREVVLESASPMCRTIYQSVNSSHQFYQLPWDHPRQPAFRLSGVKLASGSLQRVALHKCGFEIPAGAWHLVTGSQLENHLQVLGAHCRRICLEITGIWVLIAADAPTRLEGRWFAYLLRGLVPPRDTAVDHAVQLLGRMGRLQLLEGLEGLSQG